MLDKGFGGVPVVESEKLVGIGTLGDLQRVPAEHMGSKTIDEVMTKNPLATHPGESLLEAMDKMTNDRVGRLPVVSKDSGKLVGIVTMSDLIRTYHKTVKALSA
jgi:CBS domain-containing protein